MSDPLSPIQFRYDQPDMGTVGTMHRVQAFAGPLYTHVGTMLWDSRQVRNIGTTPSFERRGVATSMWEHAHQLAAENARIPKPKHSADRTDAGDAWARSVGGRLPRRV